ncbi:3,4-dihydroxy-2-butanone 4-phosphate synthase [Thalassoporum mexicanum PCC 7367]|uniref:bifunctional 3,4-dihydroxy-2-butanone-4-phosphate synthase/GTP cyclohydrolase II n=1 Tax=Thalassoporum mexicanum TaxID=3457544 RepID=UPI00029FD7BA|nr:bifunctional 3,4-dihydroxy-2-butanone-4-phosphate synthase/GTP cyclohydrolase II [Pseudanabaena sp. PCC 7367]AFY69405.1 3,4-dihydroxy-2-butanone 4-phosphate synthase [Pseudanabaena sp. PCC 7367]
MQFKFDSIPEALAELRAGRLIVVVDDENRENEGDLIGAAQFATADMINFMATHARGLICLAMMGDRLDALDLPLMVDRNTDKNQTAFTVSIDAAEGITTGISAEDRALTIQVALNPQSRPGDLRRPGHIFPLRAKNGGVLKRAGHTEAAVDLAKMAGLSGAGVICEIQNQDGSMARLPQLAEYAKQHHLKLISIADLISYRLEHERFVHRDSIANLPSLFGDFKIYAYRNNLDDREHIAIVKGNPKDFPHQEVLVRVHSECLTGDALGSLRCDCRGQLQSAMKMIEYAGCGVVVYLRQEGRGIGLLNKLKAYELQDQGLDTVEANERLGFAPDLRTYGVGAQILHDLGVKKMRLITNNPRKIAGLRGFGIEVVGRLPLLIESNDYNLRYLATKAAKLGHLLLQSKLLTLAVCWRDMPNQSNRQAQIEKLRTIATKLNLLLQEAGDASVAAQFQLPPEAVRSIAATKIQANQAHQTDQSSFAQLDSACAYSIVHIGFDQPDIVEDDWYAQPQHPYKDAAVRLLHQLTKWELLNEFMFFIPSSQGLVGSDMPMPLQEFSGQQPWQTDTIYRWSSQTAKPTVSAGSTAID